MTSQAQKVLGEMQVRKSSREKREFRAWLSGELKRLGWTVTEEHGFFAGHNVIAGDPEKAEVLFTAHYDTQAVLPVPNFITPRNLPIYLLYQLLLCLPLLLVFFDNEERGMLGSSHFAGKRKAVRQNALILNFDCVSDGDFIQFFPTKALKRDANALQELEKAFTGWGDKQAEVVRGAGFYPSDNACFRRACGVCALKKGRFGYYMDRIHTNRDTVFQEENIALLRDGCLRLAQKKGEKY